MQAAGQLFREDLPQPDFPVPDPGQKKFNSRRVAPTILRLDIKTARRGFAAICFFLNSNGLRLPKKPSGVTRVINRPSSGATRAR